MIELVWKAPDLFRPTNLFSFWLLKQYVLSVLISTKNKFVEICPALRLVKLLNTLSWSRDIHEIDVPVVPLFFGTPEHTGTGIVLSKMLITIVFRS